MHAPTPTPTPMPVSLLGPDVLVLLRFNHAMLLRVLEGVPEEVLDQPMAPDCNTPRWVLAHLAVSLDLVLLSIGVPTLLPRPWLAQFGPGSSGDFGPITPPSRADLLAAIDRAVHAITTALTTTSPDATTTTTPTSAPTDLAARFARPHKAKLLMGTGIDTIGQTITHLCTTHFALHIGQLTLVRRSHGLPQVLRAD